MIIKIRDRYKENPKYRRTVHNRLSGFLIWWTIVSGGCGVISALFQNWFWFYVCGMLAVALSLLLILVPEED